MSRWALIVLLLISPAWAAEIVVEPAQSTTRTFDPRHCPAEMPPLHDREAAVAQADFGCAVDLAYTIADRQTEAGKATISLKIAVIHMTLRLQTTVWLPKDAPDDLVHHERGHETIDKRLLEEGKSVAEPIARAMEGKLVSASGATIDLAEQAATRSVIDAVCASYLKAMQQRANRVNAEFDRITDHGRVKVNLDDAVARAFAKVDIAATQAATR